MPRACSAALFAALACLDCTAAPLDAAGGPPPDNRLELRHGAGVWRIDFEADGFEVSAGQRLQAVGADDDDELLLIQVLADRHGSEPVARSWRARLGDDDRRMLGAAVVLSASTHPERLNFWVRGALRINGVGLPEPMMFGQGHRPLGVNNWWVGNLRALRDPCTGELRLRDERGHLYCVRPLLVNRFELRDCDDLP